MMASIGTIPALSTLLPLDYVPSSSIAVAYSIRKLRTNYNGFLLNILRTSDNATTDVNPDSNGIFSLNSPVSAGGNLSTWIGSDDGFVNVWYDQSGNGNTASSSSSAVQPQIISGGSIININNQPTFHYSGSQVLNASANSSINLDSTMTIFAIVEFDSFGIGVSTIIDKRDTSANQVGYLYICAPNTFLMQWNTALGQSSVSTSPTISTGTLYSLSSTATKDSSVTMYSSTANAGSGTLTASGSSVTTFDLLVGGNLAGPGAGQSLNGRLSELIILNSIATNQQLNAIINNQRNFYNIT